MERKMPHNKLSNWCAFSSHISYTDKQVAKDINGVVWTSLVFYFTHSKTVTFLRTMIDFTTYWSQVVLTLAVAIERYIIIVKAKKLAYILNIKRRRLIYSVVMLMVVIPVVLVLTDFVANWDRGLIDVSIVACCRKNNPINNKQCQALVVKICTDALKHEGDAVKIISQLITAIGRQKSHHSQLSQSLSF